MHIKRRFRRIRHSETGEFLWLVSLSDLMILLFMFFVALFSFTKQNLKQSDLKRIVAALRSQDPAAAATVNPIEQIGKNLHQWAESAGVKDQILISKKENEVYLEIKDGVLFGSGESALRPEGARAVATLSRVLVKVPESFHIGIDGHTDDTPIHALHLRNNWQLSAERALSVLEALALPPHLLKRAVLTANAEMVPLLPNRDKSGNPIAENQSRNRRVTVRIFR